MTRAATVRRIRELREACGLGQSELARLAGLEPWRLGRIERGDREPPTEHELLALAVVLSTFARVLVLGALDEAELPRVSSLAIPQVLPRRRRAAVLTKR